MFSNRSRRGFDALVAGAVASVVSFAVLGGAGCAKSAPARDAATTSASPLDDTPAAPSVLVTSDMGSPHLGDDAPDFDLVDQSGAHVKLSSMRASVVVLAFVASYCPFSVVRDGDGVVSTAFTPALASPGVKDRTKVVVTSNLVIDRDGKIRFFTLLDTTHFDAKLVHVRRAIDALVGPS